MLAERRRPFSIILAAWNRLRSNAGEASPSSRRYRFLVSGGFDFDVIVWNPRGARVWRPAAAAALVVRG